MPRTACSEAAITRPVSGRAGGCGDHLSATRATTPRVYGARSSVCPRKVTATPGALPSESSSGGAPETVCVMPAPPVICRITRPLASLTSAHDVPLNTSTSDASFVRAAAALGVAAVAGAADASVAARAASLVSAVLPDGAGADSNTGLGNALVVDAPVVAGAGTASVPDVPGARAPATVASRRPSDACLACS